MRAVKFSNLKPSEAEDYRAALGRGRAWQQIERQLNQQLQQQPISGRLLASRTELLIEPDPSDPVELLLAKNQRFRTLLKSPPC